MYCCIPKMMKLSFNKSIFRPRMRQQVSLVILRCFLFSSIKKELSSFCMSLDMADLQVQQNTREMSRATPSGLGGLAPRLPTWLLGVLCLLSLGGFLSLLSPHPGYEWYQQRLQETSQPKFSSSLERPSILLVHILYSRSTQCILKLFKFKCKVIN